MRTRYKLGLATHLHLHARAQRRYADVSLAEAHGGRKMSQQALFGLIESLQNTIRALEWKPAGTEWADYYQATNYTDAAFEHKKTLIGEWLSTIQPKTVWDLGANTGVFSRQAADAGDLHPGIRYRSGRRRAELSAGESRKADQPAAARP